MSGTASAQVTHSAVPAAPASYDVQSVYGEDRDVGALVPSRQAPDRRNLSPPPAQLGKGFGCYGAAGRSGGPALARQLDERAANNGPATGQPSERHSHPPALPDLGRVGTCQVTAGSGHRDRAHHRPVEAGTAPPPAGQSEKDRPGVLGLPSPQPRRLYKQRLWDDGHGTRIEIYPVDQQHVAPTGAVARRLRWRALSGPGRQRAGWSP